jgi:hypothetical protein
MSKVLQANCRASEDLMMALMSAAGRAGAVVVLIQEPSVKEEEDWWKAKIKDGNFIEIYRDDGKKPYVITAVRKDIKWTDYGGSRSPERVGIDINSTRIINIYYYRDQRLDSGKIREELEGADHGNGFVQGTSTVTIASEIVMGESHLGVGVRSKKSSMMGN